MPATVIASVTAVPRSPIIGSENRLTAFEPGRCLMDSSTSIQPAQNAAPDRTAVARGGKVLVTGANGFVGGYVVRGLLEQGYEPVLLVRDTRAAAGRLRQDVADRCLLIAGDLSADGPLRQAASGCRAAVHLVGIIEEHASRGQTFERVHVEGTRRVIEACLSAGIERYIHMSALGTRPDAVSRYHQSKWRAETIVRDSPLKWTIFRPSLIHGPEGDFMRMMKFFCTSLRQPVMPYFGSGNTRIQPVSVRDVATCFVAALSKPETIGSTYDLGGPARYTWREFYDICAEIIAGHRRLKVPVPVPLARFLARRIVPLTPSFLMPHKFNEAQIQMSQEDSVCETGPVERDFGLKPREFRGELAEYASRIP
jgi:uncharacterized protein YbjT (DUF2867 family)